MQKVSIAGVLKYARNVAGSSERTIAAAGEHAPAWMREAYEGVATRQLLFSYRPTGPVNPTARITAGMLQRWLQDRPMASTPQRPAPANGVAAGVLTKMDRFVLEYAASAMAGLQSRGFAGSAAIHVSVSGLKDPLLPIHVVSQFLSHGVGFEGVRVALVPRLRSALPRMRNAP